MFGLFSKKNLFPSGVQTGFYYRYGYFLLPAGYQDISQFLTALKQKGTPMQVDTVVLEEDWQVKKRSSYELGVSIAPYFITDYINSTVTLNIEDADDVYPVMVELLTQKEYNQRLRTLVKDYCPGCDRFGSVTEKDSSLSGHFGEISLDGVCFYRTEDGYVPRKFMLQVLRFLNAWQFADLSNAPADRVVREIREHFGLEYDGARLAIEGEKRSLVLSADSRDDFRTMLTALVSGMVRTRVDENYEILIDGAEAIDPDAMLARLNPENIAETRATLKKFGLSIGVMTYNEGCDDKMDDFMLDMQGKGLALICGDAPGMRVYLLTDTPEVLRWFRYCSPELSAMGAKITVFDETDVTRYRIGFEMAREKLEA